MAMKDIEFHTTLMLGRLRSYQLTRPTVCIAPNEYAELVQIGDVVKVIALNDRFALVEWRNRCCRMFVEDLEERGQEVRVANATGQRQIGRASCRERV